MNYFIIDFDSTFTQVEALDELARISLENNPEAEAIYKQIEDLTNLAMEGKLSFTQSLEKRIQLLQANREHLSQLITHLHTKVSHSFARNTIFFQQHQEEVLIVSGGFKEFITPVVTKYHIKPENIYANTFVFDNDGNIVGYDQENPLSKEGGKVILLKELSLQGDIYGIGDGYSDYQLKESGLVKKFFAFTENIARKSVVEKADYVTPSLDEFLYINKLPRAISYPKNRIHCFVVGAVDETILVLLQKEGYSLHIKEQITDINFKQASVIICTTDQQPTVEQIQKASKLKAIGVLGKLDNTELADAASLKGIVLFDDATGIPGNTLLIPQRIFNFINKSEIIAGSNFPELAPSTITNVHRIIHVLHNEEGITETINQLFTKHQTPIINQTTAANHQTIFVVTDIPLEYDSTLIDDLKAVAGTITVRLLY